jgi:Rod binding domain-containing protein
MSTPPATGATALSSIAHAREPGWVRQGSPAVQKNYAAALAFEATLVEQLAKTMLAGNALGAQGEDEAGGEEGATPSDAGSSVLSSLLPQALAGGISSSGGFGLAAELTRGLPGASETAASGGTAAHATTPAAPAASASNGGVAA